ncbi:MAG: signal recognition particle protein, partial [Ignavibacteriaceae bacterium]|nr:signal recognition particle protein [Ignavibacteriaceae bacterium]
MIPGINPAIKNANVDEKAFVRIEAIINSMTPEERRTPKVLNGNRRKRIARGSGTSIQDVNKLIKQFGEMQKMMSRFAQKGFQNALMNNKNFKLN